MGDEEEETRGTRGEGRIAAPRKSREKRTFGESLPAEVLHKTKAKFCFLGYMQLHQSKFKQKGNQLYYANQ